MALAAGCELPLAGVIGCSAYPHPGWTPELVKSPIYLTHGRQDEVVPFVSSEKLKSCLKNSQRDVDLLEFEGGHEIPELIIQKLQLRLRNWCI